MRFVPGYYAASHGVTAENFYDFKLKKAVKYSNEMFTLKSNITPIWTLNEIAGQHSAVSMWAAGEFEFRGTKPTYYESFIRKADWKPRIDKIIPLLKHQVNLLMFYNEHPDYEDHEFSSSSSEVS